MTEAKLTVHLDEQSRKAIDELIGKLEFCGPIEPRNERENSTLQQARKQAEIDKVSLPTTLLRLLVKEESRDVETSGFVGKCRSLEKRVQSLESDLASKQRSVYHWRDRAMKSEKERDTFSGQVDHLVKQVEACHAKIERLESEIDARRAEGEKWQIDCQKAIGRCIELGEFLVASSDEVRRLKAQNRTVCVRDMFIHILPNQERNDRPTVPSDDAIRLQTRIDAEEFVEKIEALYDDHSATDALTYLLRQIAKFSPIRKDLHDRLPEFADALADSAVTNEGFGVLFGIDVQKVFDEVHAANMRKKDGPIVKGKRRKPDGWVGPDVIGVLRAQGWQPSSELKADEPIPYALGPNVAPEECPLHGIHTGMTDPNLLHCIRCENAQYNGSEVDPIGEQNGNETKALAYLAKEAEKVESDLPKMPTRHAVPIDRSIWLSTVKVEIPTAIVRVNVASLVCRVLVFNEGKDRRLMIEFLANDERFGYWERLRQDEEIVDISVDGSDIGNARIASVERGHMRPDGSYTLQVEFTKANPSPKKD